ncbi:MAG TPA: hypothetical protein VNC50_09200 [Planctomycetia bacterium]|nr:hypothetical protein [Planctomycetia bacterium]
MPVDLLPLVSRWTHVGSVILLVGGAFFLRYVLAAAASELPETEHEALRDRVRRRWAKFVHPLSGLLLLSGFYNFYLRMGTAERPWHMIAGMKILLGLGVVFLASALVGRSPGLQKIRDNWKFWLQINLILALVIVLMSGYLKFIPNKPAANAAVPVPTAN